MAKYSYYPANPEMNRYAVILASMSPEMVEGIMRLCNAKGSGLLHDLFSSSKSGMTGIPAASAKPLALFSPHYISDNDFEDTYRGLMTLLLSKIRAPREANDEYQKILIDAFNIPSAMAESIAKRIETEDILKPATGERTWLDAIGLELNEAARSAVNWAGGLINSPWEIDQKQNYDFDFLYELKALGSAVDELNSRASLMTAQATVNAELGLLQMEYKGSGDIADVSDVDKADMIVGDIFGRLRKRRLPSNVAGGLAPISNMGAKSAAATAKATLASAGYNVGANGQVTSTTPKNPLIRQAVDKILNMKPSTAMAIGAAMGLTPVAISMLKARKGQQGDLMGDIYSDISTTHGSILADAWMQGDIDSIFERCLQIADSDVSTGDPDLDEAIDAAAMEEVGDTSEIGGPFRRFRVNIARRQASRAGRKAVRKDTRQAKKNAYAEGLAQAKYAKAAQAKRPLVMARNPFAATSISRPRSRYVPAPPVDEYTLEDESLPNEDFENFQNDFEDAADEDVYDIGSYDM